LFLLYFDFQKIFNEKQTIDPQVEIKQCKQELNWNIFNKIIKMNCIFFFFWKLWFKLFWIRQ